MSNFLIPFASEALKRLPSADEKLNGFACGPADIRLFNGLVHQLQKELDVIHQAGGVAGDDTTFNTTLLNIQALIDAATGGGEESGYLLMSQARSRNPVFPIIETADNRIICSSPGAGTVRIPGGVSFVHRGVYIAETVETDFTTVANKIYHIRWSKTDGYALKDLSNVVYNPSTLAEGHVSFDSTFDDMLIARVTTNSGNVSTIVNLANTDRLTIGELIEGTNQQSNGLGTYAYDVQKTINWARRPSNFSLTVASAANDGGANDNDFIIGDYGSLIATFSSVPVFNLNRYRLSQTVLRDWAAVLYMQFSGSA